MRLLTGITISFFIGVVFFALQRKFIIISWPFGSSLVVGASSHNQQGNIRKQVVYYQITEDGWKEQRDTILWAQGNDAGNLTLLLGNWLAFLQDEGVLKKKVGIDVVALTEHGDHVYLAFDQPLLDPEWPILKKWQLIESLTRTLKASCSQVQLISFLVNDQPMSDEHIDFSIPWPIDGFLDPRE